MQHEGLTGRHATLESAGIVRRPGQRPIVASSRKDFVVHTRAGTEGDIRPDADTDCLDRVDAHHRLCKSAIQLPVPLHVGTEARR